MHFSVQHDHVHLVVEASDTRSLSSGVRSLAIRIARYVNDLLGRKGPLWADRWFGRELGSPRQMRNALVYVLANFRKHARRRQPVGIDPFSSGEWFDGWRGWQPGGRRRPPFADRAGFALKHLIDGRTGSQLATDDAAPVSSPRTWLARVGWRQHGLIGLGERPRAADALGERSKATSKSGAEAS